MSPTVFLEVDAEQVLKAPFFQGVPFHVEKDIAAVGFGKSMEAPDAEGIGFQQLELILTRIAVDELQGGLAMKPFQGRGLNARDPLGCVVFGQLSQGADATFVESLDLDFGYPGHPVEMVVLFPTLAT